VAIVVKVCIASCMALRNANVGDPCSTQPSLVLEPAATTKTLCSKLSPVLEAGGYPSYCLYRIMYALAQCTCGRSVQHASSPGARSRWVPHFLCKRIDLRVRGRWLYTLHVDVLHVCVGFTPIGLLQVIPGVRSRWLLYLRFVSSHVDP
jgi:hypothetical protein